MNTETIKVLGEILTLSPNSAMRQAIVNLMAYKGPLSLLDADALFAVTHPVPQGDEKGTSEEESVEVNDMRIRWITFHNLRSIPIMKDEETPYGISFTDEAGNPSSLYLVGRNGTGKTTLYSALEHYYLSANSLSQSMDLEPKRIMTYGFGEIQYEAPDNPSITLETVNGQTNTENLDAHVALCSPACFCSEYDIQQLGSKGKNLFDYMLQQLGFQELKDLIDRLSDILRSIDKQLQKDIKDETDELNYDDFDAIVLEVLKRFPNAKQLYPQAFSKPLYDRDFSKFSNGETPKIFTSYWNSLQRRTELAGAAVDPGSQFAKTDALSTDSANALSGKLRSMYQLLDNALRKLARDGSLRQLQVELNQLYEERKTVKVGQEDGLITAEDQEKLKSQRTLLMNLMSLIREKRQKIVDGFVNAHFDMLNQIMRFFSDNDGELLKPMVNGETITIQLLVKGEGEATFRPTPQEYYNSFRYKLYAVSFKVALSFMEMQLKNNRVPIVIDDVFCASDFENNIRLESFVYNIYKAYNDLKFEEPLQLILLTHDEMIQTAFRKGAEMAHGNFICGRLFSYKFARKMSEDIADKADEGKLSFYNLYMLN